jgi:aromatic-L-amino-acid decarboxylase
MRTKWAAASSRLDRVFYALTYLIAHRQTTASDSTLTVIVAARTRYLSEHPGTTLESLVIYVTTQSHSAGQKAAMILGLHVRALDVDEAVATDNTGLTGEDLRTAVEEDRARGLHPFVLGEY